MSDASDPKKGDKAASGPNPPTSGPEVIDYLFPLTESAAQPLTLDGNCIRYMHEAFGDTGRSNDESFQECFERGHFKEAEPQLRVAAAQHGEISRHIQQMLNSGSTVVTLDAFIAAGAAVRQLCKASCGKGQWCEWP